MRLPLLGLLQLARGVRLGQPPADGAGLLRSQVKRRVLLVLVEEAELRPLLGVDDGEDTGDGLADIVAGKTVSAALIPLISRLKTYIRFSFEPDEVIFWIRSWPSSVFSSVSCFSSSSLLLGHN